MSPDHSKSIQVQLLTSAALLFALSTPHQQSKLIQLQVPLEQKDGDRLTPVQAELTDEQLESVVGVKTSIIHVIGYEN